MAELKDLPELNNMLRPIRTGAYNFPGDWKPRCYKIADTNMSAYQQRINMINDAEKIIKKNFVDSMHGMVCQEVKDVVTVPDAYVQQCNTRSCQFSPADFKDGVGTARNYMLM